MMGRGFRVLAPRALVLAALALGFLGFAPVVSPQLSGVALAQSRTFSQIEVTGNQRIEAETIRVYAAIIPGQAVTNEDLNAAFQRVFGTGLFSDVTLTPTGNRLVIAVVENPTINIINFEGNRQLDDEVLATIVSLAPRRAYTRSAAEADAQRITDAYAQSGRYTAAVTPVIIELPDNRVNLAFEIFEGKVTEVQRISFVGNRAFSDWRLRRVVETGEAGLFSFLFSNDTYDQNRIELDQQLLREFYLERGYVDFEVRAATSELSRERDGFFINFNISEGEQYSFGEITVSGFVPGLDAMDYEDQVDLRTGRTYSAKKVDTTIERLTFEANRQGFAFIEVRPRVTKNDEDRTIDIEFELAEGPRIYIERIDIRGNTQTLDRVIRRQFTVVEGDAFTARAVRNAEQRIQALGYFSSVRTDVREGSAPERVIVTVEVEEAPTGSLSLGVAYSSADGSTGSVSLIERNFLGRGQTVAFDLSNSKNARAFTLSFTEPALFDQDLLAGFDIYYRENNLTASSVSTTNIGFSPKVGFPLSENARLTLRYRISSDEMRDADPLNTSPIIVAEQGTFITSSVGGTLTYDRRNSPIDPTAGFILRFNQDIAGLGGDRQYSKSVLNGRVYSSLFNEDVVLSAEVEGGALFMFNGNSRITDRFVLGGDSLRGFANSGVGPRDKCSACLGGNDVNDALGGNMYAVARLEASFPIGLPEEYGIFGGVFADAGALWDLDDIGPGASGPIDDTAKLRTSVGFSIFWDTAIGPLRFNFARPLQTVDGDETETFRFTVDTRF